MNIKEYMPIVLRQAIENMKLEIEDFREIRIRIDKPIIFSKYEDEIMVKKIDGSLLMADKELVESIFNAINDYSIYAHADAIKQGYITVCGGHRIGFVGQAVVENGKIKTISNISSLNIRISHEIKGVSDSIIGKLYEEGSFLNTLIISPPGFGKTTMLRDIIRNVSNGNKSSKGVNVTVIDERSEIGAVYQGKAENDLGVRCDIFDNAPKEEGMLMALRSMAPQVIAVDEIGTYKDMEAIRQVAKCGCNIIATAHGKDKEDVVKNPVFSKLINENYFQRFIVIRKDGTSFVYS